MLLTNNQITMVLIRLHGSAGWSAPLLFANLEDRFSHIKAYIKKAWQYKATNILKLCVAFVHPYAYKNVSAYWNERSWLGKPGNSSHLPPAIK